MATPSEIETALRFICKDDDGRLYAPVTPDHTRPYVYVPGYNLHAAGEEIHMISVYHSGEIEVLAGNGYTLNEGKLIDLLRNAIEG